MIVPEAYEQLRLLLWSRESRESREVTHEEALALYEANRQWVDRGTMSDEEKGFFDDLVERFGKGVFNG